MFNSVGGNSNAIGERTSRVNPNLPGGSQVNQGCGIDKTITFLDIRIPMA